MIGVLEGRRRPFRFGTYDLEWFPHNLQLRLAGVYDGRSYEAFSPEDSSNPRGIPSLLLHMLSPRYSGWRFFAHFGGRFDLVFFIEPLLKCGYHVEMAFSGSAVIRAEISNGRHKWHLCDSQFLFKTSLKKLGAAVGLHKLECAFDATLDELKIYNQRDCLILHRALLWASELVEGLGGELKGTLASTAMTLFRRAYLKQNIPTSAELNATVRPGYVSARIEPIRPRQARGVYSDVNSSFPFSMTSPLPGEHIATGRWVRDYSIVYAKVHVPDMYLPPLPIRVPKRGVFFPTGTFEGWYTSIDIELLERVGGRVVKITNGYHFAPFTDLREYMLDVYQIRKDETDEFRRYFLKILMNALYGKFSEREVKEKIVTDPPYTSCPHNELHLDEHGRSSCVRMITGRPGLFAIRVSVDVPHAHVPIPMFTTANSRRLLWEYGSQAKNLAYWDCDSTMAETGFPNSDALGGMKRECEYIDARFIAPKAYAFRARGQSGAMSEIANLPADQWVDVVKFKGFPRMTRAAFDRLEQGLGHEVSQFRSVKRALSKSLGEDRWLKYISHACGHCGAYIRESHEIDATPAQCPEHGRDFVVPKSVLRPKRCEIGEDTRPWTFAEIKKPYT